LVLLGFAIIAGRRVLSRVYADAAHARVEGAEVVVDVAAVAEADRHSGSVADSIRVVADVLVALIGLVHAHSRYADVS
jgi:CobQ-like glutamine amidotransferase family enzyme